jgi:hypothetical protein
MNRGVCAMKAAFVYTRSSMCVALFVEVVFNRHTYHEHFSKKDKAFRMNSNE